MHKCSEVGGVLDQESCWGPRSSQKSLCSPSNHSTWRCALHLRGQRERALTKQLDAPCEAVDVHQGPERVGRADPIEEEHGGRVVDAVKHTALLVHPEGDDVALVGKFLGQRLGPEAALGDQVRAGVLGQRVRVDAGGVLACEAQAQRPTPTALLLGDLDSRGWPQTARSPAQPLPGFGEPKGEGVCPYLQTTPRRHPWRVTLPSLPTIWAPFPPREPSHQPGES